VQHASSAATSAQTVAAEEYAKQQRYFACKGIGGYPLIGTPGRVTQELANFSKAGMRGIALSFVNDLDELPYFRDEVLPRLVRLKVRQPH
jgi:dimethylsulfone monooxygenase